MQYAFKSSGMYHGWYVLYLSMVRRVPYYGTTHTLAWYKQYQTLKYIGTRITLIINVIRIIQ